MTETRTQNAATAVRQDVLKSLQESDLEGIIDALTKLYRPAAIADIIQAKIGTIRLHDFVRPTAETGTWRVQEIKEDASGIRIKAARHPGYDHIVSGSPDRFISLEVGPTETDKSENDSASNDEVGLDELQSDLENAPKVKAYLRQLSREFLHTDLPMTVVVEAICSLIGNI
ncbi:MAG: hypothetical protein F6J95_030995 [Leptolyngbya sp. SIO1E4]|nr:hypothetical protein [Leptolyngbya sp. SIO1E4]